ncbi:hypothetical protein ACFQS1_13280 [Paractinoplanes rhizophilus]|jgi:hypothetical protein|uniref:Uncharacterized protein n=1 Tax=Paractinoplanes rhizophilus TaxID=1416877 RepID=A0ABW2HP10_9ACTN
MSQPVHPPHNPGVPGTPPPGWATHPAAPAAHAPAPAAYAPMQPGHLASAAPGAQSGYPAAAAYPVAAPAQAHPAQTHPAQAYPTQGYPAQAHPAPAGQMPFTACRFCGSVPAVETTFRGHRGMLVLMQFLSTEGPFCRDCGLGVFRQMTSRTLVQGWYGYASMIITPVTVVINLVRRGKIARLTPPQPNPYGPSRPPMDPGPRLLQRPMTWIGASIPFALVLAIIAIATLNS